MIINYFCCVDDLLLIFASNHTNIQAIFTDLNTIHPNLHFTAQTEQNNTINNLDISIKNCTQCRNSHLEKTHIYRYYHYHLTQHKYAGIRYLYNILHTYQLHKEEYNRGKEVIHNILYNNLFLIQTWKIPRPKQNQTRNSQIEITKQKWATFICIGKETTYYLSIRYSALRLV
jgi:hypothetical protein